MLDKIWLNSYPPEVPADINPEAYSSIWQSLQPSFKRFADRPAFYNLGVTVTYSQVEAYSRAIAAYFQQELHLKKGDRIALMLPNCLQYPVILFAALQLGVIIVNVNPLYTADELVYQLNDAGVETLVVLTHFTPVVKQALSRLPQLKTIITTQLSDLFPPLKSWFVTMALAYFYQKIPKEKLDNALLFKKILKEGQKLILKPVDILPDDIAFLQYTGGTTGVSKGAVLTNKNIVANLEQAEAWFSSVLLRGHEVIITALPLYHIFSLLANCLFFSKLGGLNVLITNPRDIPKFVREMRRFPFTAITGVNTLFNALLNYPEFAKLDFSHLHLSLGGGMAVQKAVADKWQAVTGVPLLEAYGLTETSPCVSINPPNLSSYNGTIGLPVSSTDVAILDRQYQPLSIGEIGELAIKGPQVMKEYWKNPAETAKVFTKEGRLLTGDIACIDSKGFLTLVDRKKDMILVSGFNVYPNEVEGVLAQMPGIKDSAVIGVEDANSGEIVKAYIVRGDRALTREQVIQFCRLHLTPYKVPKEVVFREELPKSPVGKVLRRTLRDEVS